MFMAEFSIFTTSQKSHTPPKEIIHCLVQYIGEIMTAFPPFKQTISYPGRVNLNTGRSKTSRKVWN